MRIGLVCPYNIFKSGGVQECVLAMQAELTHRGHQAWIITPTPRGRVKENSNKLILLGAMADFKSPFHTTAQGSVSVNTEVLQKALDEHQFDILHFHEPWVPILSRQILSRSQAKNIATFHARLPDNIMSRTIEKAIRPYTRSILKYLDSLTAVSDAGAEYIRSLTTTPVAIIPNGIDLERYGASTETAVTPKPNVLFIGRLEKRKGVKYLLAAYQLLAARHPEVSLTIAGDGPDRTKLASLATSLGLKRVRFLGYVTDDAKRRILNQATVFCSPALYGESFGIVLLEAMACGIPVVAGDNPGYRSVLRERGSLSLVDPKQPAAFARKLELLLFDQQLRALWQQWAKDYVQQFSYPRVIDQYEALYKQLKR
ncbi:glycosyltransferase family 4 protein [Candidatus Saccharibacteria bacterium]|nr:glycosyltransferase family 4 protein [Candidatus Saccharibacteria bacterium]